MDKNIDWNNRIYSETGRKKSVIKEKIFDGIEETLHKKLEKAEVIRNAAIKTTDQKKLFADLVILYEGIPIAVINIVESKDSLDYQRAREEANSISHALFVDTFYVISASGMDIYKNNELIEQKKVISKKENISEEIKVESPLPRPNNKEVLDDWIDFLEKEDNRFTNSDAVIAFLKKKIAVMDDNTSNSFSLAAECEQGLFKTILGNYNESKVCRYTSLESFYRACSEHMQIMLNIVCMNDKSEANYVVDYIDWKAKMEEDTPDNYFILSCVNPSEKNELNMWRIYGDDARGVCITYAIDDELLKSNNFYFAPICYAKKDKHPELDFIKYITTKTISGRKLRLKQFLIWQHFFKPYEYRNENEVRLLYYNNKRPKKQIKWILASRNEIITPAIFFNIQNKDNNELPLIIDDIIVGPRNLGKEVNVEQIKKLLHRMNICLTEGDDKDENRVTPSNIMSYQ